MDRFETLLTSYLEGPLDATESLELGELVRGDMTCRKRFLFQTELNGLLSVQNVPLTRANALIFRTLACLPGAARADETVSDVLDLVRTLPNRRPAPAQAATPDARHRGIMRKGAIAAAVALVAGLVVWLAVGGRLDPRGLASVATLKSLSGRTEIIAPITDERTAAKAGQALLSMNGLETDGSARVVFRDETTFVMTGGEYAARIWMRNMQPGRVVHREASLGKRVTVDLGAVHFDVTKQPGDAPMIVITPHAEILVIGTAFKVHVAPMETTVEVERGEVRVTRLEDRATVSLLKDQSISTLGDFSTPAKRK